ncbi:MAG TPA: redoxin domain-containing protein [Elusimicrobiota bacterium]|nr:redoxin domain-containing protein [Elusimicrobiota bacterium]
MLGLTVSRCRHPSHPRRLALILAAAAIALAPRPAQAQGILPPAASATSVASPLPQGPLLIGQTIPRDLTVVDSSGADRPLLSFKSPLDVLVLVFLAPACAADQGSSHELRRLYENYVDWHVAYVAIPAAAGSVQDVKTFLSKAGIPMETASDASGRVVRKLNVRETPEVLIFDETGVLHYRGPLTLPGRAARAPARTALETLIGHTDAIEDPEPSESAGCPVP